MKNSTLQGSHKGNSSHHSWDKVLLNTPLDFQMNRTIVLILRIRSVLKGNNNKLTLHKMVEFRIRFSHILIHTSIPYISLLLVSSTTLANSTNPLKNKRRNSNTNNRLILVRMMMKMKMIRSRWAMERSKMMRRLTPA
jgi:hypothetical protein